MKRISIVETARYWQIIALDDRGRSQHCNNLDVLIAPYDDREKRLGLAKERANRLTFEHALFEYFVFRATGQRERIVLDPAILMFADRLDLKQTDQAELMLRGQLYRFAGWDGIRFTRYDIVSDQSASLAYSPIFQRLFSREEAVFYRLKSAGGEIKRSA